MASVTLQNGSQGVQAKELQKLLNTNGYNLDDDGIFGSKTEAAVRDYQKKNGLTVDGIVGVNTWASLRGTSLNNNASASKDTSASNGFKYDDFSYDPYQESDTVTQAQDALNAQLAQKPGAYQSQWQSQLDEVINKIMNREKFSYDLNGDALYQQYKDKYIKQGKMAMGDAIGQASAMTGGYGNSYAQSVGQQAYQAQLENLNDIVPELYQMAYDKYNQEGQDLYNQASLLGSQEERDYGRYRDSVGDWQTERDYLAGRYDSEREYDYSKYNNEREFAYGQYADDKSYAYNEYRNAIEDEQWEKDFAEAQRQFNEDLAFRKQQYNDSKSSSGGSGGTSGSEGSALRGEGKDVNAVQLTGGSGGTSGSEGSALRGEGKDVNAVQLTGGTGSKYDNGNLSTKQIIELQKALGVDADGMYGAASKKAAGGLTAKEAYDKFVKNAGGGFTGKTYDSAVTYLKSKGVSASGLMTASEWSSRKSSYQAFGQGGTEVKNYSSYSEYLKDYVEYAIETNGK